MPIQVHLATVNTCQASCSFCVYSKPENTLPKGVMDMDLFRKIIDDAAGIPEIDSIAFSALGEPLLDRFLVERVTYARKARPDWTPFEVYTNGVGLTPAKFDALRDAGIDSLTVSLNAVNQEQHERIMGLKGQFARVVEHAQYARKNAGKVDLLVKAVRDDKDFGLEDQVRFYTTWGMRLRPDLTPGGVGQVVWMCNWAGGVPLVEGREIDPDSTCNRALSQLSILWDGKVSLCCYDPLLKHNLGDLKTQTIKEIYNAEWYTQFREDHFENRAAKYEICANCTRV